MFYDKGLCAKLPLYVMLFQTLSQTDDKVTLNYLFRRLYCEQKQAEQTRGGLVGTGLRLTTCLCFSAAVTESDDETDTGRVGIKSAANIAT